MRMVKMKPQQLTLDGTIQKFLLVKESQHTGEEAMKDYTELDADYISQQHDTFSPAKLLTQGKSPRLRKA